MFQATGEMRTVIYNSSLKRQLQVEVSARTSANDTDVVIIDGSVLLCVIPWPADGTMGDFAQNVTFFIKKKLKIGEVHLVFDRYYDYSTKSVTRSAGATGARRVHQLQLNNKLPSQKQY